MTWGIAEWRDAIEIAQILVTGLAILTLASLRAIFWSKKEQRVFAEMVDERVDALTERVNRVEAEMTALATKEDVRKILVALERQDGERKALEAKLDGLGAALRRIEKPLDLMHEHLLNRRGS